MAFDKVDAKVDFPALERDVLNYWDEIKAFDKLREKNAGSENGRFWTGL